MERSRILVIVVTYNAMKWIDRCLGSLINTTIPCDVIVVDNGSTDKTQEYIKKHYPNYIFQQSDKNLGFGKANNIGLQKVIEDEYDYAYLLNQDAWVMPDTFEKLIEISEDNPEYGVLSPIQIQANMEHLDDKFADRVIGYCQKTYPLLIDDIFFGRKKEVYEVSYVMAAHWFITRKCILTVGGFSPTFPHYGEDDNYMERVLYHNMKVGITPYLTVVHDRESRCESKEKLIYMGYIQSLMYMSSPFTPLLKAVVKMLNISVHLACKFKSFYPLINILKTICGFWVIRQNLKISLREKASFLILK